MVSVKTLNGKIDFFGNFIAKDTQSTAYLSGPFSILFFHLLLNLKFLKSIFYVQFFFLAARFHTCKCNRKSSNQAYLYLFTSKIDQSQNMVNKNKIVFRETTRQRNLFFIKCSIVGVTK